MKDTCRGENCWFYSLIKEFNSDKKVLNFEDCPFYTELVWTPPKIEGQSLEPLKVKDCSNKRSLLTLMFDVLPRLEGVQVSNEQMRNSTQEATKFVENLVNAGMRKLRAPGE